MPRLLLLRHAQAAPAGNAGTDFARPLSEAGEREAEEIGQVIAATGLAVDAVLSSSSARTRQTWENVRKALQNPPEPKFLREFYDGQASYLDILRKEAADASNLLVIGHNPSVQETALLLAADLSGPYGAMLKGRFPTAGLAVLDIDGPWKDLAPACARLTGFLRPGKSERE